MTTRWQCRRLAAALVDYVDGTLEARRRVRIETHLAQCAECAADVAALQEMPSTLQAWSELDPGSAVLAAQRNSIRAAIQAAVPPRQGWRGWHWSWPAWPVPAALFASAVLAVLALQIVARPGSGPSSSLSSLDDAMLVEVQDVTHTVWSHDELVPFLSHDVSLVIPFLADSIAPSVEVGVEGLADDELEGINDLLEGVG